VQRRLCSACSAWRPCRSPFPLARCCSCGRPSRRLHLPRFLRGCGRLHLALFGGALPRLASRPHFRAQPSLGCPGRTTRWLPAVLLVGLLAFAAIGAWLALDAIPDEDDQHSCAPRVRTKAPENTPPPRVKQSPPARITWNWMCSFPRTTCSCRADMRLFPAQRRSEEVWGLTYDEIRAIPLGGGTEFTPTFEELLAETKGASS